MQYSGSNNNQTSGAANSPGLLTGKCNWGCDCFIEKTLEALCFQNDWKDYGEISISKNQKLIGSVKDLF